MKKNIENCMETGVSIFRFYYLTSSGWQGAPEWKNNNPKYYTIGAYIGTTTSRKP